MGLPALRSLLQRLLFFNASCARWLPTRSKGTVFPSSIFRPRLVLFAVTAQLEPESAVERLAESDFPDLAGCLAALSDEVEVFVVADVPEEAHDMSTRTPFMACVFISAGAELVEAF